MANPRISVVRLPGSLCARACACTRILDASMLGAFSMSRGTLWGLMDAVIDSSTSAGGAWVIPSRRQRPLLLSFPTKLVYTTL